MWVFGCWVWVCTTGFGKKNFKYDVPKSIFLGYVPHTDQLILYYDCESEWVKITSHCKFDEGFNGLPTESVSLGFQQLIRKNWYETFTPDQSEIISFDLDFFVYPFVEKEIIYVPVLPTKDNHQFGFEWQTDHLYGRVYIDKIDEKSSVDQAFNKSTWRNSRVLSLPTFTVILSSVLKMLLQS